MMLLPLPECLFRAGVILFCIAIIAILTGGIPLRRH